MTECGLTNLAICIPEKIAEFAVSILNLAVEPLLHINHALLIEPVTISIFHPFWAIMVYIISLLYGLFFLFAGFNFMVSGYDAAKREKAKEWLLNIVLMILFVQASYLIYELMIEFGSLLTAGVINLINPDFFLMTADNITNFGLQIVLLTPYVAVLLVTSVFLALRYLLVSMGILFFPIAIFLYFIPPVRAYGKLILNVLIVAILLPFFNALILLGASMLIDIPLFSNFKIVLVTVAYISIELFMILLMLFAALKAVFSVLESDTGKNVAKAAKYLI